MVKGKAKAAGSFLGGIANNPGIVILGGLAIALLIFRKDITNFLDKGIGGITLPEINLPDIKFPEFKFPEFSFPDFSFPDISFPDITFPEFKFPEFTFPDLFGQGDITPPEQDPAGMPDLSLGLAGGVQERRADLERGLLEKELAAADIPLRDIQDDIEGLTPAQRFAFIERGVIPTGFEVQGGILQKIMEQVSQGIAVLNPNRFQDPIKSFLDDPLQKFEGGGVSFQSGSIFETPLANLTLNQIIEKLGVTASQASSLRREAQGFPSTETGFTPPSFFNQFSQGLPEGIEAPDFGGFTGDTQFQGLTPQEIVLRLLGGNIQNF